MISSFLKKHWYIVSIVAILMIAIVLRFYKLGVVPHGMTWDEAAIGYNGYSILTTRRDEWLQRLPVSFQSFGDYKAPLAIYLNGFFTFIFGMNLFAVRFPFALGSIATILGFILLTKLIFKKNKLEDYYSLFAGFLLTLSPWHLHYSRAGFESGLALMFLIWGLYFLLVSIDKKFKDLKSLLLLSFSGVLFVLSMYTYHSSKIVVPLLLITVAVFYYKLFFKKLLKIIIAIIIPALLLIPLLKDTFMGEGLTRASVTIFSHDITILEKITKIFTNFLAHLSPSFLIFGETTTLRHGTGAWGVLFGTTLLLFILGLLSFTRKNLTDSKIQKLFVLIVIIGIIPAAVATEIPHSNRSFLALPGFIITAVFGLDYLIILFKKIKLNKKILGSHGEKDIIVKSVVGILLAVHILLSVSFINYYFNDFNSMSADSFKDGYLEAFEIARQYEKGEGVKKVDKIIFTSSNGQPYIYALFVRKTNPIWYRGGSLNTYQFSDKVSIGDLSRKNTLVVANGDEESLLNTKADHLVYGSDGEIKFRIFRTD